MIISKGILTIQIPNFTISLTLKQKFLSGSTGHGGRFRPIREVKTRADVTPPALQWLASLPTAPYPAPGVINAHFWTTWDAM